MIRLHPTQSFRSAIGWQGNRRDAAFTEGRLTQQQKNQARTLARQLLAIHKENSQGRKYYWTRITLTGKDWLSYDEMNRMIVEYFEPKYEFWHPAGGSVILATRCPKERFIDGSTNEDHRTRFGKNGEISCPCQLAEWDPRYRPAEYDFNCIAVVDGKRCEEAAHFVKLCKAHYYAQQQALKEGFSLTFIEGYNKVPPAQRI